MRRRLGIAVQFVTHSVRLSGRSAGNTSTASSSSARRSPDWKITLPVYVPGFAFFGTRIVTQTGWVFPLATSTRLSSRSGSGNRAGAFRMADRSELRFTLTVPTKRTQISSIFARPGPVSAPTEQRSPFSAAPARTANCAETTSFRAASVMSGFGFAGGVASSNTLASESTCQARMGAPSFFSIASASESAIHTVNATSAGTYAVLRTASSSRRPGGHSSLARL